MNIDPINSWANRQAWCIPIEPEVLKNVEIDQIDIHMDIQCLEPDIKLPIFRFNISRVVKPLIHSIQLKSLVYNRSYGFTFDGQIYLLHSQSQPIQFVDKVFTHSFWYGQSKSRSEVDKLRIIQNLEKIFN